MGSQLRTRMGICPLIARLNCCTFALPISPGASRTPVVGRWALAGVRHLRWGMDPLCIPDAIAMGGRSSCPFRTAAKKRQVGMMKVSDEAWREMRILYSRVAEGPLSGKISLKCTLGQPIMAK